MKTLLTILACVISVIVLVLIYTNIKVPVYITILGIVVGIKQVMSLAKN